MIFLLFFDIEVVIKVIIIFLFFVMKWSFFLEREEIFGYNIKILGKWWDWFIDLFLVVRIKILLVFLLFFIEDKKYLIIMEVRWFIEFFDNL